MVDPIPAPGGQLGASALGSSSTRGLGSLDGDAFLKLMVAQLRHQNPFQPMDTSQMLQQTASLTTVETLQQVASGQRVLMGLYQATMAASLMGKQVEAMDASGERVTGVVRGVGFAADGPILDIDGKEVPIGNVISMKDRPSDGAEASTTSGTSDI